MSRYFRLMALAANEILFSLPFSIYLLVTNLASPQNPWISWADTHQNFGYIGFIPRAFMEANPNLKAVNDINRWVTPGAGLLFFAYFGLAGEAAVEYRKVFWKVLAPLGIKTRAAKPQTPAWYVPIDILVWFICSNLRNFVVGPTGSYRATLLPAATSSASPHPVPHSMRHNPRARLPETTSLERSRSRSSMIRNQNMISSRRLRDDRLHLRTILCRVSIPSLYVIKPRRSFVFLVWGS